MKKMPSKSKKTKKTPVKRYRVKKWTDQQKTVERLLEKELEGLVQYTRSLHWIAIIIMLSSIGALIYALRVLFQNDQQAVVGFLVILVSSLTSIVLSTWVLRPWILPRFLLPMDIQKVDINELIKLISDPDEYLQLVKSHIQSLTDEFLLPKLKHLRNALVIMIFGVSIAIILAIALP